MAGAKPRAAFEHHFGVLQAYGQTEAFGRPSRSKACARCAAGRTPEKARSDGRLPASSPHRRTSTRESQGSDGAKSGAIPLGDRRLPHADETTPLGLDGWCATGDRGYLDGAATST